MSELIYGPGGKKEKDQKSRVLLLSKSQPQVGEHVVLHSNWNPNGELQGVKIQKDGQCMRMLAHGPKSQHEVRGGRSPRRKGPDMSTIDPADADSRLSAFHERRQIQSKIKYFQSCPLLFQNFSMIIQFLQPLSIHLN